MVTKVNGFADLGEFLTGNIDFFTITTLVPCESTGVSKSLSELKKDLVIDISDDISIKGGISIFGILYNTDEDYSNAFNKQSNLNMFIKQVEQRAQAIMLNGVNEGSFANISNNIPNGGHVADFGTNYSGNAGNLYTIKFATEHENAWESASLADELNNRPILDLSTDVIDGVDAFNTLDSVYLNTIILKNQFI